MKDKETLLGGYLRPYMRPSGVRLADMDPEDRKKPTVALVALDMGLKSQSSLIRKLNGERPITEQEAIWLAIEVGASPVDALLIRLADRLECEPGSVEEMVREVVEREAGS